jgi:AAA domain
MSASPQEAGREVSSLASFLPGRVPDRVTWEGWTRWRLTRHDFTPAPLVTAGEHAAMTAKQRRLNNLHRIATHSNLKILDTPMSTRVSEEAQSLIQINAFDRSPGTRPGLMVNGGACQGKTETVCEALASFEDGWLELYQMAAGTVEGTLDHHVPVVYVRTPVKATPVSACQRILDFYGEDHKGMTLEMLLRTVRQAVHDHGTMAIAIDDITRLKLHREADQDVLDLIRELMSIPVTLILIGVGIYKSGLLRNGYRDPGTGQWVIPPVKDRSKSRNDDAPDQTDLRFDPVDLDRFSYGDTGSTAAWIAHLVGVEEQLRLLNARDGMLSDGDMPEYLFERTRGIVGILRKLIQKACHRAIVTGEEEITTGLLESMVLTRKDFPGLDPDSGEIPEGVLAGAPAAKKPARPRKPRNTVFDDHGAPAAGTAG